MCANDVLAQGAEPLFFLDYFATGRLDEKVAQTVVAGIAEGCRQAGCALIGGETAEMPGMYADGHYDLAGFCVGAIERGQGLPRPAHAGDVMLALASSGAHSNGFSLIRNILETQHLTLDDPAPFAPDRPASGACSWSQPRIYIKSVLPLLRDEAVRGVAHITGGGLTDNVPRILPASLTPAFDDSALALPPLFEWLQHAGGLSCTEMRRVFNIGIGAVLVCAPDHADRVMQHLSQAGETCFVIGTIVQAQP